MIEGIDIFAPRDSGLPDLSKITAAQIFNGSALAGLNAMKDQHDPYGLLDRRQAVDPVTGKPVEVRRARIVSELLDGKSAKDRGHRKVSGGGGYTEVGSAEPPDLPENPSPPNASLLDTAVPEPNWHPPMLPPGYYSQPLPSVEEGPSSSLLPPELLQTPRSVALRRLPTTVLEELKNLRYI